jgi:ankyrin repeat-rich membrane spanning protein
MPVRFHFSEINSAAQTGESAVGHMLANLFDAVENYYGSLPTRLYRAFRPKPVKVNAGWRFRKMCCVPIVILFEAAIFGATIGICLLILYYGHSTELAKNDDIMIAMYVLGAILLAGAVANLHAWAKALNSLFFSQGRYLKQIIKNNNEFGLTALGAEVMLMADMVKCLDAFTGQQSRLVGVIDTLDSCDTERTLSVLNSVQTLLMTPNRPFVLLLAVDPHVVAKAAEANSKRLFTEGGIGGHDFLRNLVHLPVYLQNSGLRKVQRAQATAMSYKRIFPDNHYDETGIGHSASARRLSNASEIMSSTEKLRGPTSRPGSKKLRLSESIASSIGSNIHKLGTNQPVEFSKIMLTDDYFSDVNPRSMRRLMNVIYITVRLLKAFQIDFSWYRLSSWINLTEQWPLRASMIVLEHDLGGESLDENVSLQSLYDKVRPKLSCLREAAALLDLDRDERKLDAFLSLHKSDLQVSDLRIFLPFTINLDPYLRKVLKEDQQALEDEGFIIPMKPTNTVPTLNRFNQTNFYPPQQQSYPQLYNASNSSIALMNYYNNPISYPPQIDVNNRRTNYGYNINANASENVDNQQEKQQPMQNPVDVVSDPQYFVNPKNFDVNFLFQDLTQIRLSKLTSDDLIALLKKVNELKSTIDNLLPILKDNAITGKVLMYCDLNELKNVSFFAVKVF